ncbi:MAG TPA: hypothetical protein DIW24_00890 [Bacteroidetes bacterium]|nr:hypothetical protein [Bacteroidota bacterium]
MSRLIWVVLVLKACLISANAQNHVTALPHESEGIMGMLRRFELPVTPQMVTQFRRLNNLKPNEGVKIDQTYRMPIRRYRYNQKSIRTTLGISDYSHAQRIADYNNRMTAKGVREDNFLNSLALWVPDHEAKNIHAATTEREVRIPKTSPQIQGKTATWPIFGSKYATITRQDTKLAGRVYYIDAGHGGPDPGAISKVGGFSMQEDEYAYDIALRLSRNLLRHGAKVYLIVQDPNDGIREGTRLLPDKHEVFWGNIEMVTNFTDRLRQRSGIVNALFDQNPEATAHRLLSIHVDSRSLKDVPNPMDPHFSYYSGSDDGARLSRILFDTMKPFYTTEGRSYSGSIQTRDQLYMLLYPKPVAILIETANIQHPIDQGRLMKSSYRQAIADRLTTGLLLEAKTDITGK